MPESLFAVFGDVHANLEALQAVLADMDSLAISQRICLGDTVGYAANPAKCLQAIRDLGCPVLLGNHDQAAASEDSLQDMRDIAQAGIEYAREKLSPEQRSYLAALPLTWSAERRECVHASLDEPGQWHYIMREPDARLHFAFQSRPLCFCGHTHVPIVWHQTNGGLVGALRGVGRVELPRSGKTLVNVGSVGQPRDSHPEACYVVCDQETGWVEFRRVPYDIAKARRKILRAKLPRFIATRLLAGQ